MANFSKLLKAPDKRSWATLDQIQFLVLWLPDYIEAQEKNDLPHFWPKLFVAWFEEWPLPEVTDDDVLAPEQVAADDDSDVPPESADEVAVKKSKRDNKKKENKRKLQAKKVCRYFYSHTCY